ncbi:MAG: TonB-dependent receptor [Chlorobiales bacterium]|nr:TonB-dependent receptor [Chlorobiales bacterium]
MKRNAILLILLLLQFIPAFAQDSLKTHVAKEMVVTATKLPESPGNPTQKIDVIDSEEISTIVPANRNIAEAIQYTPGVSVSVLSRNDANWGTYGGIGPKYSTYMLQGLPIDAFVDPMALDLSAVAHIEVQRGPASVLYPNYLSQDFAGNQSPLAGTVNLLLKEKIDGPMTRFSTAYGSYNTLTGQAYHQNKSGNLTYFAGAFYDRSDYTNYGTSDSWLNMHKDPEYRKTKFYAGATWFPAGNDDQKFTFFVNKTIHEGDAGRVYRGFEHDYSLINAGYFVAFNERVSLQAHLGYRQYDRTWQESNFGVIDTLKSNNGAVQRIVPVDVAVSVKHGEHLLTVGTDYQGADYYTYSDPLQGYKSYGNKSRATQAGIYAQEVMHFDALTLRGGLRFNYTRNQIDLINGGAPGQKSEDWNRVLWSVGAKYRIDPELAVFANAGSSFMTPGLKSVGGTISLSDKGVVGRNGQLPNPDLKPESGLGIDGGAEAMLPMDIKMTLRGFYIAVDDAIIDNVVSTTPSQTQSINAGKSTSVGVEVGFSQQLTDELNWFANYTYMNTEIKNDIDPDQDGADVPFAPTHVANVGLGLSFPFGLKINPFLNYNDGYYDSSSKSGRKKFEPGIILNVYVSQLIASGTGYKVEVFGQFYNLTDNRYEMPWEFRAMGISTTGGLVVTF